VSIQYLACCAGIVDLEAALVLLTERRLPATYIRVNCAFAIKKTIVGLSEFLF
jgi:hypothetical protein